MRFFKKCLLVLVPVTVKFFLIMLLVKNGNNVLKYV